MSEIQFEAVVGEDGELLKADQDVDMEAYAAYVKAAHPDPTRFQRLWDYISGSIFLFIVVFVAIAIMVILSSQAKSQRSDVPYEQAIETQQAINATSKARIVSRATAESATARAAPPIPTPTGRPIETKLI